MENYALVDKNGFVFNTIIVEDIGQYSPPEGALLIKNDAGAGIGWTYKNETFSAPSSAQTPTQTWSDYQAQARAELESTAKTMERILEGIALGACKLDAADVVSFMEARKARRDVLSQPSGDPSVALPKLIYPQGT